MVHLVANKIPAGYAYAGENHSNQKGILVKRVPHVWVKEEKYSPEMGTIFQTMPGMVCVKNFHPEIQD